MAFFDSSWQQRRQQQPIGPSQPPQGTTESFTRQGDEGNPDQEVQDETPQKQQAPAWDRTAFRDAWMSSGVQNVPDMQNWLKSTGWGQHVGTAGSKGDVMQLPSGENIDAVLAAGLGGNRGGPQWTGRGSWNGSDQGQGNSNIGPSQNMMQGQAQGPGYSQMQGGMQQQPQKPMSRTQQQQGMGVQGAQMMRPKRQQRPGYQGLGPRMNQQPQMGSY